MTAKRKFFSKLVLFVLSAGMLALLPVGLAVYSGDAMPFRLAAQMQSGSAPVLYNPVDETEMFSYKLMNVSLRQPEVILIGSSRVEAFRAPLLNRNPSTFYNACGRGLRLREALEFLRLARDSYAPRVMIIGFDQFWFLESGPRGEIPQDHGDISLDEMIARTRATWDWILVKKLVSVGDLLRRRDPLKGSLALGSNAILTGAGYRNDGSRQDAPLLTEPWRIPEMRERAFTHLENRARQVLAGDTAFDPALSEFEAFLSAMPEDTVVIGVFLPYMPSLYDAMIQTGEYGYIQDAADKLAPLMAQYGGHFFDFTNAAWVGGTDEDLWDGWHASERLTVLMYMAMLDALPDVLGSYSDMGYLQGVAAQPLDSFDMWDQVKD